MYKQDALVARAWAVFVGAAAAALGTAFEGETTAARVRTAVTRRTTATSSAAALAEVAAIVGMQGSAACRLRWLSGPCTTGTFSTNRCSKSSAIAFYTVSNNVKTTSSSLSRRRTRLTHNSSRSLLLLLLIAIILMRRDMGGVGGAPSGCMIMPRARVLPAGSSCSANAPNLPMLMPASEYLPLRACTRHRQPQHERQAGGHAMSCLQG